MMKTYSMTGYGKHSASYQGRVITVEIRTLNSKQSDVNVRMPSIYREKEFAMRDMLSEQLHRGKIDLSIQRDLAPDEASAVLNETLVGNYYTLLKKLEKGMEEDSSKSATDYLSLIMKMPDALKPASDELQDEEFQVLHNTLVECIKKCNGFREQEGAKLALVLADGTKNILANLKTIEPMEAERIERIKSRITGSLTEGQTDSNNFDRDRFEQELIFYLEKIDITEEKVRLKAHCDFFLKTLNEEELKGKKLSFIAQEMGREINTLGSKAQHFEIQKLVVGMKDELEKIKEQMLNVL
jgi:uncharacterized protein (TIGR00255 family)